VPNSAGTELFGFIPAEVLSRLKNLTSTGYTHEYFVDGDIVVSPKSASSDNKNLLFATLGRGGKGLFSLDVTEPAKFVTANFRWEYTPAGNNKASTDADLGFMLGRPLYVKMNNGKSAVIVGNGYNSAGGKAVLYIFVLNKNGSVAEVKKLDTLAGGDNGLASVGVFDADGVKDAEGEVTADFIYGGDLNGNVWKFDISGTTTSSWVVGLGGAPLFVAKDSSNKLQPITAPLTVGINTVAGSANEGKRFVFFGTGSFFRAGDPADKAVQTWYGLIDENTAIGSRSDLATRTIAATGDLSGYSVRGFSAALPNDMVNKKGWYLDFDSSVGERIVTRSIVYKFAVPTLVASSIIPNASDPCSPGGTGYINAISPFSGGALGTVVLDVNRDGNFTNDKILGLIGGSVAVPGGMPGEAVLVGKNLIFGTTGAGTPIDNLQINPGAPALKGRISWREIIKD
jgi:type IV pilus assembly protein PilY1